MGYLTSEQAKKAAMAHHEKRKKKTPTEHLIDYLAEKTFGSKSISKRKTNRTTDEGSKSRGGDITPNIFSLIHPLVQSRT